MAIKKYTSADKQIWDNFLSISKNATFLFRRDFIEYHGERFIDHSVLIFNSKKKLLALFPACQKKKTIHSHSGLSYGGIIFHQDIRLHEAKIVFQVLLNYFQSQGFQKIIYKQLPYFYQKYPNYEEDIILYQLKAQLIRKDIGAIIDLQSLRSTTFLRGRSRELDLQKAQNHNLKIIQSNNLSYFWKNILIPNLKTRHQISPTHSLNQITYLVDLFPKNIRFFSVQKNQQIVAGTLIFQTDEVAHAQYIASSELGKKHGALTLLFQHLVRNKYSDFKFFSFGISTENQGKHLNQGLHTWKESFGARAIPHNIYQILI